MEDKAKNLIKTINTLESRADDILTKLDTEERTPGKKRKEEVTRWLVEFQKLSSEADDLAQKYAACPVGRRMQGSHLDKLTSEATRLYEYRFHEGLTSDEDNTQGCGSNGIADRDRVGRRDVEQVYRRRINSWQKGKLLGQGSCGTVYEGLTNDGFFFAVKEISLSDQGSEDKLILKEVPKEISLLRKLEHENIVQYFGSEKDDTKLYIFLELMKGSLAKLYKDYKFSDSQVSAYTRQILNGLKYLHDQSVVHRDIKCANILVDASGSLKLADFGLAKATIFSSAKTSIGTAFWVAPEVLSPRKIRYGPAADIWSLGCTVLEMFTGEAPYFPLEPVQALFRISKGKPPKIPDSLSSGARKFILRCLQADPKKRPTAALLLDDPFVSKR